MQEIRSLIETCVKTLAAGIGPRPAGSAGQDSARDYISKALADAGLSVEIQQTDCPRWQLGSLSLRIDSKESPALVNPHSPDCHLSARVVRVETLDQLKQAHLTGHIVAIAGELTAGMFFPRNFDFFRDERQDEIISTLEQKAPLAVIMVSGLAHAAPLIADPAFLLPSVTVAAPVGAELADGRTVELAIAAKSQPACAANIIARGPADGGKRVVVCAHYDTAYYTPGAVDNAAGVAALLALAKLFASEDALGGVELVAFAGEDSWYPAEVDYLRRNAAYFPEIAAAINIDGIGMDGHGDTVTFLGCPEALVGKVTELIPRHPGITSIDPWYAGDHSLFWREGIPALALTSAGGPGYAALHTERDTVAQVDAARVEATARFVHGVVRAIR